eukprot:TRINITY_DN88800_c0_g1_i1.p1 TRINITY_DN88800_c0_g1~~TRINITY_DN88800_c0_g1_i1.p1  ORF type:complete len:309 (-),score=54.58 TRINITY_DN88800_c0_g1_i1:942-1808(-)
MLALFVNSLDGSRRRIEVPLARTMADIMEELEVGLPDLHEVKLVQGMRQVGDHFQLEVQGVTTPSARKALDKLQQIKQQDVVEEEDCGEAEEAVALLATMHLNREDSERLLRISTKTYYLDTVSWDMLTGPEQDLGLLSQSWGESFGYACCDPESYVPRLCQLLFQSVGQASNGVYSNFVFSAAALAKLVDRTAIPMELAEQLTVTAADQLHSWVEGEICTDQRLYNLFGSACKLLGLFGGVQHERLLIDASKLPDAATALQLIHGRMAGQMTKANSVQPKLSSLVTL